MENWSDNLLSKRLILLHFLHEQIYSQLLLLPDERHKYNVFEGDEEGLTNGEAELIDSDALEIALVAPDVIRRIRVHIKELKRLRLLTNNILLGANGQVLLVRL